MCPPSSRAPRRRSESPLRRGPVAEDTKSFTHNNLTIPGRGLHHAKTSSLSTAPINTPALPSPSVPALLHPLPLARPNWHHNHNHNPIDHPRSGLRVVSLAELVIIHSAISAELLAVRRFQGFRAVLSSHTVNSSPPHLHTTTSRAISPTRNWIGHDVGNSARPAKKSPVQRHLRTRHPQGRAFSRKPYLTIVWAVTTQSTATPNPSKPDDSRPVTKPRPRQLRKS
jgi:hypothetical protein